MEAHHVIGVQLRLVGAGLYVEVWDSGDGSPVVPEQRLDAEGGRGLFLVECLSEWRGICRPAVGGKIIWAELTLTTPVRVPLLVEALPPRDPGSHGPMVGGALELVDMALMQRALKGFCSMPRSPV
jgi:hypothetical protein